MTQSTPTPNDIAQLLASPDAPCVLDMRIAENTDSHPVYLRCANLIAHDALAQHLECANGRAVIVYWHAGLKLSHGAAARLRGQGIPVDVMAGGIVRWIKKGLPSLARNAATPVRIAAPQDADLAEVFAGWLVIRFVAPKAELFWVPRDALAAVGLKFDATRLPSAAMLTAQFHQPVPQIDAIATFVAGGDPVLAQLFAGLSQKYCDDPAGRQAMWRSFDALYRGGLRPTQDGAVQ
jgi:rhodanese-related sulfurtransferase